MPRRAAQARLHPERATLRIARPERVVFPLVGFTKAQVVDYYLRGAPFLLPHLVDRPVSLKRYPDEAGGEFFWEKDAPAYTPAWVRTVPVWRRSGDSQIHYIVVDDLRTLAWAASVGTLEFHPFLSRAADVERPTAVVFDLDPGPPAGILDCARVAMLLRHLLQRLGLQSWAKVSGSKGIQVYAPLNTLVLYADTQPFAKAVAMLLARQNPGLVVSEMERAQRQGRVFIDWSQNADYKTTVAVYSLRAKRRHPYISIPVAWEELEEVLRSGTGDRLYFSPERAFERLHQLGDLFAPVLSLQQQLPAAFEESTRRPHPQPSNAPPSPRRAKLLHMPSAGTQGGRRTFRLRAARDQQALRLELQRHETVLC